MISSRQRRDWVPAFAGTTTFFFLTLKIGDIKAEFDFYNSFPLIVLTMR
jgi:hypothetical protein